MDVVEEVSKTPKKALKSMTTSNLRKNILVQAGLVSAGAIAGEYADTFLADFIAKAPIPSEYVEYVVPIVKGIGSVMGMAAIKNYYARMALFGVLGQSMLSLIRAGLAKVGTPAPTSRSTAGAPTATILGTTLKLF